MKKKSGIPWVLSSATPERKKAYATERAAYEKKLTGIKRRKRFWTKVWILVKGLIAAIVVAVIAVLIERVAGLCGLHP